MELTSTRDDRLRCGGYEAIFRGIAPDGGLYVPAALPALSPDETSESTVHGVSSHII